MFHVYCQDVEVVPGNQMLYLELNSKERLTQKQVVIGVPSVFSYTTEGLADAGAGFHSEWV